MPLFWAQTSGAIGDVRRRGDATCQLPLADMASPLPTIVGMRSKDDTEALVQSLDFTGFDDHLAVALDLLAEEGRSSTSEAAECRYLLDDLVRFSE